MYKNISYDDKLNNSVRNKHIIPYRLGIRDKYEKNAYYYSNFYSKTFKVLFVKYYFSGELEGADVKYDDGMHAYICTDIDPGYDYKVIKDFNNIYKKETIINDDNEYTGAEIRYWFFINNITCFDRCYKGFWKFVDTFSRMCVDDYTKYKLTGDLSPKGIYYNCKVIKQ